jgi:hypothetical protein
VYEWTPLAVFTVNEAVTTQTVSGATGKSGNSPAATKGGKGAAAATALAGGADAPYASTLPAPMDRGALYYHQPAGALPFMTGEVSLQFLRPIAAADFCDVLRRFTLVDPAPAPSAVAFNRWRGVANLLLQAALEVPPAAPAAGTPALPAEVWRVPPRVVCVVPPLLAPDSIADRVEATATAVFSTSNTRTLSLTSPGVFPLWRDAAVHVPAAADFVVLTFKAAIDIAGATCILRPAARGTAAGATSGGLPQASARIELLPPDGSHVVVPVSGTQRTAGTFGPLRIGADAGVPTLIATNASASGGPATPAVTTARRTQFVDADTDEPNTKSAGAGTSPGHGPSPAPGPVEPSEAAGGGLGIFLGATRVGHVVERSESTLIVQLDARAATVAVPLLLRCVAAVLVRPSGLVIDMAAVSAAVNMMMGGGGGGSSSRRSRSISPTRGVSMTVASLAGLATTIAEASLAVECDLSSLPPSGITCAIQIAGA